jgi:hypothetical protein
MSRDERGGFYCVRRTMMGQRYEKWIRSPNVVTEDGLSFKEEVFMGLRV